MQTLYCPKKTNKVQDAAFEFSLLYYNAYFYDKIIYIFTPFKIWILMYINNYDVYLF